MSTPAKPETPSAPQTLLAEVKYSLPDLLAEIANERATGSYGMEKLEQQEIQKLFKSKPTRRAKIKK
jgi:hypothetical protein